MLVRKVYNVSTLNRLMCCWNDCENDGVELHKIRVRETPERHAIYVFCSERHKMYFAHSHRSMGNLPPGYRYVS